MPANKNKLLRMQTIITMMRKSQYPNFSSFLTEMKRQDAAGAFQLSSKTFQRDIADLKDEFHAPIRYDSSRRGFFLTNTEWYNEELMIEPFEMKAALLGERVACGIFPEPMRSQIARAVGSLLMKNESGMAEGVELENLQILNAKDLPGISPEIFIAAYNAWEQRKYMRLVYRSSQHYVSEKLFEPHVFAWNGGCWYLKGKVHRSGETHYDPPKIMVLALHRVEKAEVLGGQFWPAPEILKGIKQNGLFDFEKLPEVIMEFFPPFDTGVKERFAGKSGASLREEPGKITLSVQNIPEYEALNLFFLACGKAKVIAPESLRKKVVEIAQKMIEINQTQPRE